MTLGIKFHSMPVYDGKYIKTKPKKFHSVVNTNLLDDGVPKKGVHYSCVACINVESVMKIEKKNCPQIYLEQCKLKKKRMPEFIDVESDSSSDPE